MSIFDDIVPGNDSRTPNLPEGVGSYKVRIETLSYKDGRTNPSGREGVVVEFKIVESNNPAAEIDDFYSCYFGLDGRLFPKHPEIQRKELLTFLVATMGYDPDKPEEVKAFRAAHKDAEKLYKQPDVALGRIVAIESTTKVTGPRSKTPGKTVSVLSFYPAGEKAEAPTGAPAEWQRSPDGIYALNPSTNAWHVAATGLPA